MIAIVPVVLSGMVLATGIVEQTPAAICSAVKPHCGTTLCVVNRDAERRATILQKKQRLRS